MFKIGHIVSLYAKQIVRFIKINFKPNKCINSQGLAMVKLP